MRRGGAKLLGSAAMLLVVLGIWSTSIGCSRERSATQPPGQTTVQKFETEYQAVLLANGQLFFGRLEGFGTHYPVLREAYYVRTVPDPADGTKTTNILVKRGQEWHAPDFMVLSSDQIVLIEPVTRNSKVAQLIAALKEK